MLQYAKIKYRVRKRGGQRCRTGEAAMGNFTVNGEEKLVIAVCEDDERARKGLSDCLNKLLAKRRLDAEVAAFSSAGEMLEAMNGKAFPVNFLDIYMEGTSGVELAWKIVGYDPEAAVVFTTNSREHMAEGFCVGAVHYLIKPYTEADVSAALDRCLRLVDRLEPYAELYVDREKKKVLFSGILWVEFRSRCCYVHTRDAELKVYMRLEEMARLLDDPRFCRCHRSYIVNMDYAEGISGCDFVMNGGTMIPIRREDKARVKAAFEDYYFEKSRRGAGRRM